MDPRKRLAGGAGAGLLLGGEDDMEVDEDLPMDFGLNQSTTASASQKVEGTAENMANPALYAGLIHRIITPSPFPQHNAGTTSFRFRNALNRVLSAPTTDVEAWQALMTEVQNSFRSIQDNLHAVDAEIQRQLDWVESCYGNLLVHFPYAAQYAVRLIQVIMAQSARLGEEDGPRQAYGRTEVSRRALDCEAKLERLLEHLLGFRVDGTALQVNTEEMGSTLTDMAFGMCTWSVDLWIQYVRKVKRDAARSVEVLPVDQRASAVREKTVKAFDLAVSQAGFVVNNQLIWKEYLDYVKSWRSSDSAQSGMAADHALAQQQMVQLRSVYKRLVVLPMTGLDQLWQEYEAFEKAQSEALASALIQELQPKYQHARNVYLERNRVYSTVDLQIGQRLATPPPVDEEEADYAAKMEEDDKLLRMWKQRCSYERINPERLTSNDLNHRIRSTFKELASTLTRHIEVWHMWSSWELLVAKSSTVASGESDGTPKMSSPDSGILKLGQIHIPDSTLLAYAEAEMLQRIAGSEECLQVMAALLDRNPTTLGFVLYQRMVRQRKGIDAAREVFGKARRTLLTEEQHREVVGRERAAAKEEEDAAEGAAGAGTSDAAKKDEPEAEGRWMVTNRLDARVGASKIDGIDSKREGTGKKDADGTSPVAGPVTWHLFASHAAIEHRINRLPDIAARVYELGLRKHASFLSKPAYVQRYAQLLAELGDILNLKSLLTKAVAACEKQGKKDALGALWDISLHYESIMTASDSAGIDRIQQIECQRREALMGPEIEDVATGSLVGYGETALVGAQKSTIAEQLIRSEGYDTGSRIVNGLSRTVDVLAVMGVWGNATSDLERRGRKGQSKDDDLSGSRSDKSFQKRLDYHAMKMSGSSGDPTLGDLSGNKGLSARERLQQAASGPGSGPMTAIMLAIQQMPDWLRPLLLMLPASRLRIPVVAKPPPHLIEMALSTLKQNDLPAERPSDGVAKGSKRSMAGGDGDSSDEEGGTAGSGYSNFFRARQRTRMISGTSLNGTS